MSIQTGDPIPNVRLFELDDQGAPRAVSAAERFAGKRIILFAVPGAFTRTCSQVHLPSFVQHADAIKAKGIDEIVCVAVNDAMVLAAWGREHGATGKINMLSDGLGEFTRALGLEQDLSDRGLGMRSKRYAMLIEDGQVAALHIEPPSACEISRGDAVLQRLAS
jgi:glutaredoxin/glutathione-dependent peroxiredoxin